MLGFHPLPFHHVLLASALRSSCSTSQGSCSCPLILWHPLPALCHPAPGEQATAASLSRGKGEQACSPPLRQVGHAVQPAKRSPALLTHPQIFTARLPCAYDVHSCRQMHPVSTEFLTYPKELTKNMATSTATADSYWGLIGLARPRGTGRPSPSQVTLAREGGWASLLCHELL